jgi:hypothetical protein
MTRRWLAGGRPPRSEGVVRNGAIIAHSSFVIRPWITANLRAKRSASNHIAPREGKPLAKKDRMRITIGTRRLFLPSFPAALILLLPPVALML